MIDDKFINSRMTPPQLVPPGTEEFHILDGMICPISSTLMTDPVVLEDGHSYERSSITHWLNTRHTVCVSPMTGLPLSSSLMIPNHNLRRSIQDLIRRIPTLLLSPKLGQRSIRSTPVSTSPNMTRLLVSQSVPQSPVSVESAFGSPAPSKSVGAVYVLSSSLGFFGSGSGLIGTAVETPSFIEGQRKFTASSKGSSTNSRWVDFMILLSTPTPTHIGTSAGRIPLFSFQATEIATAVGGPSFGCVLKNPLTWSNERKVNSLSATDVVMDNLEALVDDCGYYIDGSGWFKQPSGESQQMGWFPGKIHKNDIVSLFLTSDGQFQIELNDKLVASAQTELPRESSPPAFVWCFVSLNGTVKSVRLLERLWHSPTP